MVAVKYKHEDASKLGNFGNIMHGSPNAKVNDEIDVLNIVHFILGVAARNNIGNIFCNHM